ncbi:MAG: amino-acid N-acetyltransferase [Granulosicoccus sp.]
MANKAKNHKSTPSTAEAINWFRHASPYINAHRGRTLVLCLPGSMLKSDLLPTLTHDLTLLSHLGLRLVLCFGLRAQMDEHLRNSATGSRIVDGRRVTDVAALQTIVTASGLARSDLEARLSMGMPNTPMRGAHLSVCSGNFVTAQPFGVHDGVDFQHTGAVREIQVEAIQSLLEAGHLVMLPPLGHSLTGDIFNLPVSDIALATAIALEADKLVFFVDELPLDQAGIPVRQASATRIEKLLANLAKPEKIPCSVNSSRNSSDTGSTSVNQGTDELARMLSLAVSASRKGVERVHLLRTDDPNALLRELFTVDGSGTMVTAERWETVRPATIRDVGGIIELISPLQANGTLAVRSREQLELDIEQFAVSERDGTVIACAALYLDDQARANGTAEIACVATHPDYRGEGRADHLLNHLETVAKEAGSQQVLLLSTRTGHWFVERGYVETSPNNLPDSKRGSYNSQRQSKVFIKQL